MAGAYGCDYLSEEFILQFASFLATVSHANTSNEYVRCVRSICNFAKKDFLDLTRKNVDDYFSSCNERGLSASTIRSRYYRFVTLSKFLDERVRGLRLSTHFLSIRIAPTTSPEASEEIREKYLPAEKFEKLVDEALESGDRMAAVIFSLSYKAALSASEVCGLRVDQIFRDEDGTVFVHLYDDSYNASRTVYLRDGLGQMLDEFMQLPKPKNRRSIFVFLNKYGNPLTLRNLNSMFRKHCIACGFGEGVSFRDLRSSGVVRMFSDGTPQTVGETANLRKVRLAQYADAKKNISELRG